MKQWISGSVSTRTSKTGTFCSELETLQKKTYYRKPIKIFSGKFFSEFSVIKRVESVIRRVESVIVGWNQSL